MYLYRFPVIVKSKGQEYWAGVVLAPSKNAAFMLGFAEAYAECTEKGTRFGPDVHINVGKGMRESS